LRSTVEKQRQSSVNEIHETVDAAVDASDRDDNRRKSTSKLLEVENGSSTVVLMLVAVCAGALITLTLLVIVLAMTRCRSRRRHIESDGPENNDDDALCGIRRLLGGVRRQRDKRRTSDHRIDVAIVNDSGIGTST